MCSSPLIQTSADILYFIKPIQEGEFCIWYMCWVVNCNIVHDKQLLLWGLSGGCHKTSNWDPTSAQAALDDRYHGNTMWSAQAAFDDCYHGSIMLWVLVCLGIQLCGPVLECLSILHWYTYCVKFVLSNIQQLLVTGFVYTPPSWCRLTVGVVSRRGYV